MAEGDNYTDVLLEDINAKFDAIMEIVQPLVSLPADVREIKEDVSATKADLRIVKAAVTDQSHQLNDHERRILALET